MSTQLTARHGPMRSVSVLRAAGYRIEMLADGALVDGVVRKLSAAEMAILQALAERPGRVVTRDVLLGRLPGDAKSTHAVETAVLRLRTALGDKRIVGTVVKRGYRLTIDEQPGPR